MFIIFYFIYVYCYIGLSYGCCEGQMSPFARIIKLFLIFDALNNDSQYTCSCSSSCESRWQLYFIEVLSGKTKLMSLINVRHVLLTSLSCCSVSSHVERTAQHQKPQHAWICAADAAVLSSAFSSESALLLQTHFQFSFLPSLWFLYPAPPPPTWLSSSSSPLKLPPQTTTSGRPRTGNRIDCSTH